MLLLCERKRPGRCFCKTFPQAKLVSSENEILEDNSIQLIVSASIPVERAPLGIRVMQHGKDFMDCSDQTLPYGEQLVNDIINRTETAMHQEHCFLATELALKAPKQAEKLVLKK